jgi:hypothetical protein
MGRIGHMMVVGYIVELVHRPYAGQPNNLLLVHRNPKYLPQVLLTHIPLLQHLCNRGWAFSPMVGRSSGTLPNRVQILVLAPFPGFIPGFSGVIR